MITYPSPEDIRYYLGRNFTVEWYYTEEGELPALDYYRGLGDSEQARLDYIVRYLADAAPGTILSTSIYRIEDRENRVYALKAGARRFFNFTTEHRRIIITNAYRKHAQKMTRLDLNALVRGAICRTDYLRRVREGTYYETQGEKPH